MWVVCCGVLPPLVWGYLFVGCIRVVLSLLLQACKQWSLFVGVVGLSCVVPLCRLSIRVMPPHDRVSPCGQGATFSASTVWVAG